MAKRRKFPGIFMGIAASAALLVTLLAAPALAAQTTLVNRKLSGEMPDFGDVFYGFKISPDSQRVFFTANKISPERLDLYSAPITGDTPLLLGEHIPDDPYMQFEPSPDGKWVVFLSEADTPGLPQLYRVPLAGGDIVRLNADLVPNGEVYDFQISPDSRWVLFSAAGETAIELQSVPIEGGVEPIFLDYFKYGSDYEYRATPDSTHVVILESYYFIVPSANLTSVPIQGGINVYLDCCLVTAFQINPNSLTVVYIRQGDQAELFSIPVRGGIPPVKVSAMLVNSGNVIDYMVSRDDLRVMYLADQQVDEQFELYSVAISGGETTRLSGDMPPEGDVLSFRLSPDGSRVVYYADQEVDETYQLYSAPVDGNQPAILLADLGLSAWDPYQISPDGSKVVFARFYDDDLCHLFSVPVEGGASIDLTGNSVWGSCGVGIINPDSQQVTFGTGVGLYSVRLDGQGLMQLNSPLTEGGWINNYLVAPDSRHTVYRADQDALQVLELYVSFEANSVYLPLLIY